MQPNVIRANPGITDEQVEEWRQWSAEFALSKADQIISSLQDRWRPIETAPKDGTRVLLAEPFEGGFEMSVGWWRSYINDSDDAGWMDGTVQNWAYEENTILQPTHWMPLPPIPSSLKGSDVGEVGE